MSIQSITTSFISKLGNPDSLVPILVKDSIISGSLTLKSYKEGGSIEGKDRLIDEFGTEAVWLSGIPAFKKLADLTAYKAAKLNPAVDVRILADKEYAKWALQNAQGFMSNNKKQSVKDALIDSLKDGGEFAKKLYTGKIIAATSLALGAFFLMTKLKQNITKTCVMKGLNAQQTAHFSGKNPNNTTSAPAFKGIGQKLSNAVMFNPVHNLKVIDTGIAAERLGCSRNKTELGEHAIKEGGFFFFIYWFGNYAEAIVKKFSNKFFNKPIDLKIDLLTDIDFKKSLESGQIEKDLKMLPEKSESLTSKLNFLINNPDNIFVKAAKKSGIVKTVKNEAGKNVIDTSAFIDIKELEILENDLKNINNKFKTSGETITKFLAKTKGLKAFSILTNIVLSCLFLGYGVPKMIYAYRKHKTGSTKFHVEQNLIA